LGAEAVSEFTDKTLFKERLEVFHQKPYSKCKIAYCLCPLLAVVLSCPDNVFFSILSSQLSFVIKFVSLSATMKFYDKYPKLKEKGFLAQVLTKTVFSTMSLENQQVSMSKVEEIVFSLLKEQELKGGQFFSNQGR
jgi:hypothetical protein